MKFNAMLYRDKLEELMGRDEEALFSHFSYFRMNMDDYMGDVVKAKDDAGHMAVGYRKLKKILDDYNE